MTCKGKFSWKNNNKCHKVKMNGLVVGDVEGHKFV